MPLAPLALIVCYAKANRVIGADGQIPWHEPEDLAHFKRTTMGHAIIQGRRSYQAIGRPLPGRRNILVSRNPDFVAPGCEVAHSLAAAITRARETDSQPFICGGEGLYTEALDLVTRCYLTEIDIAIDGDARFPPLDENDFVETDRRQAGRCLYRVLERRPKPGITTV